jgi:hypothetical protein
MRSTSLCFHAYLYPIAIGFPNSRCRSTFPLNRLSEADSPCCLSPVARPGGLYLTHCISCLQGFRGAHLPGWLRSSQVARPQAQHARSPGRVPEGEDFGPASRRNDRVRPGPPRARLPSATSRLLVCSPGAWARSPAGKGRRHGEADE